MVVHRAEIGQPSLSYEQPSQDQCSQFQFLQKKSLSIQSPLAPWPEPLHLGPHLGPPRLVLQQEYARPNPRTLYLLSRPSLVAVNLPLSAKDRALKLRQESILWEGNHAAKRQGKKGEDYLQLTFGWDLGSLCMRGCS